MSTSLHETLIPWTCLNINIVIVVNYLSRIMTIATRVRQEIYLIRYYWWRLLLTIAFMFYMCLVVSRNVAFMRHYKISHYVTNQNASFVRIWILEDIGFQIIPNWSHNKLAKDFNEIINAALIASIGVFCIVTLFLEKARVQKNICYQRCGSFCVLLYNNEHFKAICVLTHKSPRISISLHKCNHHG